MNSESKQTHTPGPWWVAGNLSVNSDPHPVAAVYCVNGEANAALIAAAPDLLAALWRAEDAVNQLCIGQHPENECWNVLAQIRAALSRAEGKAS